MAGKFIELNEAAKLLGLTPDELVEMRSNGDIHGYRDGASWKFKAEEIERVAAERGFDLGSPSEEVTPDGDDGFDALLSDLDLADPGEGSSILVSDEIVGAPAESSSTIIGKGQMPDSDLRLVADQTTDSDIQLTAGSSSELGLDVAADTGTGSDLSLANSAGSATDSDLALEDSAESTGSDLALDAAIADSTGSDLSLDSDSDEMVDLKLSVGSGTDALESASDLGLGSSDLDLADDEMSLDEDDDLVLGGSGVGSDVKLGADSGINLASPSDSGLSLEDPSPEVASSASGLGLASEDDDDEIIALEEDEGADSVAATRLKQDEEFLLSPYDELGGDDSELDSGSQVIALDDSAAFDQEGVTMLAGEPAFLAEEGSGLESQLSAAGAGVAAAAIIPGTMVMPGMMVSQQMPEPTYSIANVLGLAVTLLLMTVGGMVMVDVVRNLWAWDNATPVTTSVSDSLVSIFRLDK